MLCKELNVHQQDLADTFERIAQLSLTKEEVVSALTEALIQFQLNSRKCRGGCASLWGNETCVVVRLDDKSYYCQGNNPGTPIQCIDSGSGGMRFIQATLAEKGDLVLSVMRWLPESEDLSDWMQTQKNDPDTSLLHTSPRFRYKLAFALLRALACLSRAGIIHSDIKLDNTLLDISDEDNPSLIFIDYGFAMLERPGVTFPEVHGTEDYCCSTFIKVVRFLKSDLRNEHLVAFGANNWGVLHILHMIFWRSFYTFPMLPDRVKELDSLPENIMSSFLRRIKQVRSCKRRWS